MALVDCETALTRFNFNYPPVGHESSGLDDCFLAAGLPPSSDYTVDEGLDGYEEYDQEKD